jgi:hypothetical protein
MCLIQLKHAQIKFPPCSFWTVYSQSCWYFRPSFVNCSPSNLLSGSTPPLLCIKVQYTVYRQCVAGGGGGGLSSLGDHFLQKLALCI